MLRDLFGMSRNYIDLKYFQPLIDGLSDPQRVGRRGGRAGMLTPWCTHVCWLG